MIYIVIKIRSKIFLFTKFRLSYRRRLAKIFGTINIFLLFYVSSNCFCFIYCLSFFRCKGVLLESLKFQNIIEADKNKLSLKVLKFVPRFSDSNNLNVSTYNALDHGFWTTRESFVNVPIQNASLRSYNSTSNIYNNFKARN